MRFASIQDELDFFKKKIRFNPKLISTTLKSYLDNKFPNLSVPEQFYLEINNYIVSPLCTYNNCNVNLNFISVAQGYSRGCCKLHSQKLAYLEKYGVENPSQVDEIKQKRTNTLLKHYGVENAFQSKIIKENIKQKNLINFGVQYNSQRQDTLLNRENNNLIKYGVKHTFQLESTKDKIKQTILEKYGVDNPSKSCEIKNKIRETNFNKYGVYSFSQSSLFKHKVIETSLIKYGVASPNQFQEIKDKQKNSMLKKYGFSCNFSNKNRTKLEQTWLDKYGVTDPNKRHMTNLEFWNDREYIIQHFLNNENQFMLSDFCSFFNCSFFPAYTLLKKLDINYNKIFSVSKPELEIINLLQDFKIIQSDRKILNGLELDILIPSNKVAIEYNGLYWHSNQKGKHQYYHLNKTNGCLNKGIKLIHIFENEWNDNKDFILSIIYAKLNCFQQSIYARKCQLNIQDNVHNITISLNHNDCMVLSVVFEKSDNHSYKMKIEGLLFYQVKGGLSKIINHFIKNYCPHRLISVVDKRYWFGESFVKLGFEHNHTILPTLHIINKNQIWDCGFNVYIKNIIVKYTY